MPPRVRGRTRLLAPLLAQAVCALSGAGCNADRPAPLGLAPDAALGDGAGGADGAQEDDAPVGADGGQVPGPGGALSWVSCPLHPGSDLQAECAVVAMPLRHEAPERGTLNVHVMRLVPESGPAPAQLWLLSGGPGGAGSAFAHAARYLQRGEGLPFDIYMPDHRGTGGSSFLGCPRAMAVAGEPRFAAECAAELVATFGDQLGAYTTTEAALDLGRLIELTRAPGQPVLIYGGSYGSYWAHRYLQLHPDQADGVVTDGNCLSSTCRLSEVDAGHEAAAQKVLQACAADLACQSKLPADPWGLLADTLEAVRRGHCAELGLGRDDWRRLLVSVGLADGTLLPAVLYRLARCAPADVMALATLIARLRFQPEGLGPAGAEGYSLALYYHVALSELWPEPPPSVAELEARDRERLVTSSLAADLARIREAWPVYARDRFADGWAAGRTPVLMLQGALDFATPLALAERARDELETPHQLVVIPGGDHAVALAWPCAYDLFKRFILAPGLPVDAGCVDELPPIGFLGTPEASRAWFGTEDYFESP